VKESKRLKIFRREFERRQKQFGLCGYQVFFEEKKLEDCFANITQNHGDMVATARVNSDPHGDRKPIESAKHEAIHLLIGKLEYLAKRRYVSEDEIYTCAEELTVKLMGLIP